MHARIHCYLIRLITISKDFFLIRLITISKERKKNVLLKSRFFSTSNAEIELVIFENLRKVFLILKIGQYLAKLAQLYPKKEKHFFGSPKYLFRFLKKWGSGY